MRQKKTKISPVETPQALDQLRALLQEYWTSFAFSPCFQDFAAELQGLPGAYVPPAWRLAIAYTGEEPAGCVRAK